MDSPTKQQQRKSRFRRETCENFCLTDRDREIIRQVYRHRFLSSEHVQALIDGGRQGILNRLKLLFHSGYLDRPKAQGSKEGNFALVYALGNKGAELIAQEFDLSLASVDWTTKNRELKPVFLEHTLLVADFMVSAELACRKVSGIEFIRPEYIIEKRLVIPKATEKPLSWKVETKRGPGKSVSYSMVPDNAFGLRFSDGPPEKRVAYFFVEADRATMPIRSANLGRSSFYKKVIGYWESWRNGLYAKNFGFKNPRVLTLTTSEARAMSMVEMSKQVDTRGTGMRIFLFAPHKIFTLKEPERVLDRIWINGRGEKVSLLY